MSYAATAGSAPSGSKAEPWRNGLWVVLSAGLLYCLLHATLRLALSSNLPQDDVTANILAQTLEPGYLPRQPPLYEWLLWMVQRVAGPHDALRQATALGATGSKSPETVSVPWQPWPPFSPERSWSWSVLVADLGPTRN